MNQVFFDALEARLVELTAELRFLHKPSGVLRAPEVLGPMKEEVVGAYEEADDYPFVRWIAYSGEFTRMGPAPFSVKVDAGIYTAGTIADGNSDIFRMALALGGIVDEPWRFTPYKLGNRVPFHIGSPEKNFLGLQPHPLYLMGMQLDFAVARGHGG